MRRSPRKVLVVVSGFFIRPEANLRCPEMSVKPHIKEGQSNVGVVPDDLHTRSLDEMVNHVVRSVKDEDIINVSAVETVKVLKILFFIESQIQIGKNRATMDPHWDTVRLMPKSVSQLKNRAFPEKFRCFEDPIFEGCITTIGWKPVNNGREGQPKVDPRDRCIHGSDISRMQSDRFSSLVEGSHFFTQLPTGFTDPRERSLYRKEEVMYDDRNCGRDIRVHGHNRSDFPWVLMDFRDPMEFWYVVSFAVLF